MKELYTRVVTLVYSSFMDTRNCKLALASVLIVYICISLNFAYVKVQSDSFTARGSSC